MKKVIAWNSNLPLLKTGLAKNTKYVLDYLYKTNKYDIVLYSMGFNWEHPEFERFPYRIRGCLPNNPLEIQQINNSDEGVKRAWAYGGGNIEKFLKEIKPFAMIFSDDIWAFPYQDKPWWNKFHTIPHITIDSLPILPQGLDLCKKSELFTVWSWFAERELNRLGFNNVKTIPGCIDQTLFKRFDASTRREIKQKYGLPTDSFIVGTDSRNQLRKEFPALLEGFSIFLRQNPEVKNAYIFLITTHCEGWNLMKYVEEFKIPKERFLALYLCANCQETQVRPFNGQDLECKFCKEKNSQKTIRIDFGCSEEQLNEAYNLFDGVCHIMNSGGHELVLTQALYSEVPLATVDYSSGSPFCEQKFVTTVENHWTRQIGTEFIRACPYPSSVAKFIKKLYDMSPEKRQEIGKIGREWAISKFSPEVVGKQWENLIDSLPERSYDFNFEYKSKNDAYPYKGDSFENELDFIIDLYQNVLYLQNENSVTSPGVANWLQVLKNGGTKKDIYEFFIKTAKEENAKNTTINYEDFFDKDDKGRRLLLSIPESFGDCFLITSLFPSIKEVYPNYNLYVACKSKYKDVFMGNPRIHKVIEWIPQLDNIFLAEGQGTYPGFVDIHLMPYVTTQRTISYVHNGKDVGNVQLIK